MKAMTYAQYGGTEVLKSTEQPVPKVSPGCVLVRVKAAGVNPMDWKIMAGWMDDFYSVRFPVIPGADVAGIVEAVGIDTPEFAVGDEVYSFVLRDTVQGGTFAELVSLPASMVAHKPASLSWEQAAGLPQAGLAALRTLDSLALGRGDTLLIHNGSGGVGRIGIQLAVDAGIRVIATTSPENFPRLRELGAEVVGYGEGLVDRVRALAPGGVDAVADFIGDVVDQTMALLKPGGRHASIADWAVLGQGGLFIGGRADTHNLDRLSRLVDAGALTVDVFATYPLQDAAAAFQASMLGHSDGKIVMTAFTL
jgi:NADPH:quinone reductase-like Zn-dependent oxidoreductase